MSASNVGKRAEAIALQSLQMFLDEGINPSWFLGVRPGRKAEDADGYDLVINTTDVELLGLQVKSSPWIKYKQRMKYEKNGIPVIFIPREVTSLPDPLPREILLLVQEVAIALLGLQREVLLLIKRGAHQE